MEKIAIAELNLDEVLQINKENALAALDRAGGRILFIEKEEYNDEQRLETKDSSLLLLPVECGFGMYPGLLLGADKVGDDFNLLFEDTGNNSWDWCGTYVLTDYNLNRVCEEIIRRYNKMLCDE